MRQFVGIAALLFVAASPSYGLSPSYPSVKTASPTAAYREPVSLTDGIYNFKTSRFQPTQFKTALPSFNGFHAAPRPQEETDQRPNKPRTNGFYAHPEDKPDGTYLHPTNGRYALPRPAKEEPRPTGVQKFLKSDGCSYECDVDVSDPVCGLLVGGSGHQYSNQCMFEGEHKCFPGTYSGSRKGYCHPQVRPRQNPPAQRPQPSFAVPSEQAPLKQGFTRTYKPNGCNYECEAIYDPVCAITPDGKKTYRLPSKCTYDGELKCDPEAFIGFEKGECKYEPRTQQQPPSQTQDQKTSTNGRYAAPSRPEE